MIVTKQKQNSSLHVDRNNKSTLTPQADTQFKEALELFAPGGGFESGILSNLERERAKYMSSGMSNLVSSGLANTTMVGNLANKFSEEVAAPTLAGAETNRVQNLSNLKAAFAGMLQTARENQLKRGQQMTMANLSQPSNFQSGGVSYSPGTPSAGFLTGGSPALQPATTQPNNLYQNMKSQAAPNLFA